MISKRDKTGESANLYDVSIMLEDHKREGGPAALFKEMMEAEHAAMLDRLFPGIEQDLAESAHVFIVAGAAGMLLAKAPKEMAGVVSIATANMSLYRDPIVARNTACCDFRISDLMNHGTPLSLYLVVSPADIDRTRPLFRIFISQLSGRLMEKMEFSGGGTKATYKHRLLLMLDEFTSLGKLAIIERAIAYMAGYGMKAYFVVPEEAQFQKTGAGKAAADLRQSERRQAAKSKPAKKKIQLLPQFIEDQADIVSRSTEQGIDGVIQGAQQAIPSQLAVVLHVTGHRLNSASSPQLFLHLRRQPSLAAGDQHLGLLELAAVMPPVNTTVLHRTSAPPVRLPGPGYDRHGDCQAPPACPPR